MSYADDFEREDYTPDEYEEMNRYVAECFYNLSNPFNDPVRLEKDQQLELKPGDILVGFDAFTKEPIIVQDDEISTHYCFIGATGSGKTQLAEDFIAKMYFQKNNVCTIIPDIKGEWYDSLKYKRGGKELSHFENRLFRITSYQRGLLKKLARKDVVIILDLSGYSFIDNIICLYNQIRDFVKDIADWIKDPKEDIQLNCLFEESALWFPNTRSDFREIFKSYDQMLKELERREKLALEREKTEVLFGVKDKDERALISNEYKLRALDLVREKLWGLIQEICATTVSSILLARSRQCSIGFLVQRASLILTTIITQTGLKFIKRQTDKNDIERIKPTVMGLHNLVRQLHVNQSIVVSSKYLNVANLGSPITHHVAESSRIKHYKKLVF